MYYNRYNRSLLATVISVFLLLPFSGVCAKDSLKVTSRWHQPLNIPLSLSANYGELRGGHFHAGIDLRVNGVIGEPVLAIDSGYVSRISVTPSGYGNALYITHSDGLISVYGHLHDFIPEIASYVKREQYARESFRVDLYPEKDLIKIKRGQKIGRAGNSGSSGGPHLHLEIRDGDASPQNIVSRGYIKITDNIAPQFNSIAFYSYCDTSGVVETELIRRIRGNTKETIELPERSFIGIEAFDRQDGTHAKLSIEEYKIYLDDKEIWVFKTGEFLYSESPYIKTITDYALYRNSRVSMLRTLIEPGNILEYKYKTTDRGVITLNDDQVHRLKVVISDEHGNRSSRSFNIRRKRETKIDTALKEGIFTPWFKPNYIVKEGVSIYLPVAALYRSIFFILEESSSITPAKEIFSKIWSVHDPDVTLARSVNLKIEADLPDSLQSKALLASLLPSGVLVSAGGSYRDGYVSANISAFGDYCVTIDTIPPKVTPRFKTSSKGVSANSLSFSISDEFSGIASYRAEIDGKWVLAEFDQKSRRLSVILDRAVVPKNKEVELVLKVVDNKDNSTQIKYKFVWR